jgi:Holliday junction DNA helicase RuvA
MISRLKGTVVAVLEKQLVLDVSGVGYGVFVKPDLLGTAHTGSLLELWTYLAVRENALDLFGFETLEEKEYFELLITIPGIGPRSALSVLSSVTLETLGNAIATENTSYLTKISGIGRKTAEKIVLELKGKIGKESGSKHMEHEADSLEALRALGYGEREIRDVLKTLPNELEGTSARVREALKRLGKK